MLRRSGPRRCLDLPHPNAHRTGTPAAPRFQKYPFLISYHRVPWLVVEAGSAKFHETVGQHYPVVLDVASKIRIPGLKVDTHLPIPSERWLSLLPGAVYVTPWAPTSEVSSWAPYGWEGRSVNDDPSKLAFYGAVDRDVARVHTIAEFSSPDLRLSCVGIGFKAPHCAVAPASSLADLTSGFALFQFFRPNRSPSELVKPLEKFYVSKPELSGFAAIMSGNFKPKFEQSRKSSATAGPMSFSPPTCYQWMLPERRGVKPGDAFGRRDLMWGYWT